MWPGDDVAHRCERVFNDKLTNYKDIDVCTGAIQETIRSSSFAVVPRPPKTNSLMVNAQRRHLRRGPLAPVQEIFAKVLSPEEH